MFTPKVSRPSFQPTATPSPVTTQKSTLGQRAVAFAKNNQRPLLVAVGTLSTVGALTAFFMSNPAAFKSTVGFVTDTIPKFVTGLFSKGQGASGGEQTDSVPPAGEGSSGNSEL